MRLVVGWLEMVVILYLVVNNIDQRQQIFDDLDQASIGSMEVFQLGIMIDMVEGTVTANGKTYEFTPVFHLTGRVSLAIRSTVTNRL